MQFMIVASGQSNVPDATEVAMRPVEGGNPQCRTEPLAAILSANPRTATMQSALPRRRSVRAIRVPGIFTTGTAIAFIGLGAGTQITLAPTVTTAAGLLGGDNYGPAEIGTDILATMGTADMGAIGFTPPLGADAG
jgi:hypothetical protein